MSFSNWFFLYFMGSHETRAGSAIARATDGYLSLATENRRHATATITVVNGTFELP